MLQGKILIVDDNKSILSTLELFLGPEFHTVHTLLDPNRIPSELRKLDYNLVILDMNFNSGINNGNEGIYWLNRIKSAYPDLSVVMITAYGDVELTVKALKAGATDFVLKPWVNAKLLATVKSALQLNLSKKEVHQLKEKEKGLINEIKSDQKLLIGSSPRLMKVLDMVRKVAKTDANVVITGENGTGKELIAHEIHRHSRRSAEVMVNVDMGAITETLFESELFGHVKGAFTDARENRPGKFEIADKGTLFLDEIGNLSFHLQAKLLAAVQNRQISRIGSNQVIPIDIRLICATNKDLHEMVRNGLFREDLLYRINTVQIEIPPLRERGNDILLLTDYFLKKFSTKYNKPHLKCNQSAQDRLMSYAWPGNVRELQHTIEKAVIMSDNDILKPEDFFMRSTISEINLNQSLTLEEMEKHMISLAMDKNNGNLSATAEQLGITRQTLYNKIKKFFQ
jgi:DNA-binding NtrC family response regulator